MINASTISPKKRRRSTNDTASVHQYVIDEKKRMLLNNERATWETSKITRKRLPDGSMKVTIKRYTIEEED
jgi:hypothetical protein